MMTIFTTRDGTDIFYKDWGSGRPVVLSHGWPLRSDAWEAQMMHLAVNGFRVVAHDRRGFPTTGKMSASIAAHATLKVYPGGAHGLTDTARERLSADLLDFAHAA